MGWNLAMDNSYYGVNLVQGRDFASYTNDSGVNLKLVSVTADFGVGIGEFTAGESVTGSGSSIILQLSVGSSTSSMEITHLTDQKLLNSKNQTYPDPDDFASYKFEFSSPITVNNGSTITITAKVTGGTGTVLCFRKWAGIVGFETQTIGTVSNYTLTVSKGEGISEVSISAEDSLSVSVPAGSTKTIFSTPSTGYHFKEWTGFTTTVTTKNHTLTMPNSDLSVIAKGEKNLLTINPNGGEMIKKYDPNSVDNVWENTTSSFTVQFVENQYRALGHFAPGEGFAYKEDAGVIGQPVRVGYTFSGWNVVTDNGYVTKYDPTSSSSPAIIVSDNNLSYTTKPNTIYYYAFYNNVAENAEIKANWNAKTIETTFYRNHSSTDTITSTQTFTYDVTDQAFSDKGWTKTGYSLLGWSKTRSATSKDYNVLSGVTNNWINTYSPSINLYAVWQANTYTLTYNANGGSGAPSSQTWTYGGTNITLSSTIPVRTGYTFKGWSTSSTATSASYAAGATLSSTLWASNRTLYAVWEVNWYKLTLTCGVGVSNITISTEASGSNGSYPYGSSFTITANIQPGYKFKNWTGSITGDTDITSTDNPYEFTMGASDVSLYASADLNGFVWIYTKQSDGTLTWQKAIPYIYTNSTDKWKPTTPYVYKDSTWTICGE